VAVTSRHAIAFAAGALFALGLGISGLSDPAKVLAFLDVTGGAWDPALMFVMGAALAVHAPVIRAARGRSRPWRGERYDWPEASAIDRRLVAGAAIFGVGWGLSGYCPGPALVGAASLYPRTLVFIAGVIAGAVVARALVQKK
jgi:uncharacterized membrane protein YedE/YeeE